jgi:hypothetical protein
MITVAVSLQAEVSIVGTWTYKYSWGCGSSYSTSTIIFYSNGTFSYSSYTGTWKMVSGDIIWEFSSGTTYAGSKIGSNVQGMMVSYSGLTGCFYLIHSSTSTSSLVKAYDELQEVKTSDGITRVVDADGM